MYGLRYHSIRIKDQQLNLNMVKIQGFSLDFPLKIISKDRPISIRLQSIKTKIFRFIFPFLRGIPVKSHPFFKCLFFSYHPSLFWFCCSRPTLLHHQNPDHNSLSLQDKFCASGMRIVTLMKTNSFKYIWI